jgi:hypothetical protein
MAGIEAATRNDGRIEDVRVAETRRLAGRSNRPVDIVESINGLRGEMEAEVKIVDEELSVFRRLNVFRTANF